MCCKKQGFVNSRSHYLFIQHYIFQLVDDQLLLSATSKLVSNLDKNGADKATVYVVFFEGLNFHEFHNLKVFVIFFTNGHVSLLYALVFAGTGGMIQQKITWVYLVISQIRKKMDIGQYFKLKGSNFEDT